MEDVLDVEPSELSDNDRNPERCSQTMTDGESSTEATDATDAPDDLADDDHPPHVSTNSPDMMEMPPSRADCLMVSKEQNDRLSPIVVVAAWVSELDKVGMTTMSGVSATCMLPHEGPMRITQSSHLYRGNIVAGGGWEKILMDAAASRLFAQTGLRNVQQPTAKNVNLDEKHVEALESTNNYLLYHVPFNQVGKQGREWLEEMKPDDEKRLQSASNAKLHEWSAHLNQD